ncbi:MAG: hypothetical protein Q9163_001920 [Psora crenata]
MLPPQSKYNNPGEEDQGTDLDHERVATMSQRGDADRNGIFTVTNKGKQREETMETPERHDKFNPDRRPSDKEILSIRCSPLSMVWERARSMQQIYAAESDIPPAVPPKNTPMCFCGDPLCTEDIMAKDGGDDAMSTVSPPSHTPPSNSPSLSTKYPYGLPVNPRDKSCMRSIDEGAVMQPSQVTSTPQAQRAPVARGNFLALRRQLSRIHIDVGGLRVAGAGSVSSERRIRSLAEAADEVRVEGNGRKRRNVSAWLKSRWSKHV